MKSDGQAVNATAGMQCSLQKQSWLSGSWTQTLATHLMIAATPGDRRTGFGRELSPNFGDGAAGQAAAVMG
jgi:hypothetical protein